MEGLVGKSSLLEQRTGRRMIIPSESGLEMKLVGWWAYTVEATLPNDLITSERVAPASERSVDVEQQAQEDNLQLPKEVTG